MTWTVPATVRIDEPYVVDDAHHGEVSPRWISMHMIEEFARHDDQAEGR